MNMWRINWANSVNSLPHTSIQSMRSKIENIESLSQQNFLVCSLFATFFAIPLSKCAFWSRYIWRLTSCNTSGDFWSRELTCLSTLPTLTNVSFSWWRPLQCERSASKQQSLLSSIPSPQCTFRPQIWHYNPWDHRTTSSPPHMSPIICR